MTMLNIPGHMKKPPQARLMNRSRLAGGAILVELHELFSRDQPIMNTADSAADISILPADIDVEPPEANESSANVALARAM